LSIEELSILFFTITGSGVLLIYGTKVLIDTPFYTLPFLSRWSERWMGNSIPRSLISGGLTSTGTLSSTATLYSGYSLASTGVLKPEFLPTFIAAALPITVVPIWFSLFHWGWYELVFLTLGFLISAKFKSQWAFGMGRALLALGIIALGSRLLVVGLGSHPELAIFSNQLFFSEVSSFVSLLLFFLLSLVFMLVSRSLIATLLITSALLETEFFSFSSAMAVTIISFCLISILPLFQWKKLSTELKNASLQELIIKTLYGLLLLAFINQLSEGFQSLSLNVFDVPLADEEFLDEMEPYSGTFHLHGFPLSYLIISVGYIFWAPIWVLIFRKLKFQIKEPSVVKEFQKLFFMGETYNVSPHLSLKQLRIEIQKMAALVQSILQLSQEIFQSWKVEAKTVEKILKYEGVTDRIQIEINDFISRIMRLSLTTHQGQQIRSLLRMTKELESLADGCKALIFLQKNLVEDEKSPSKTTRLKLKAQYTDFLSLYEQLFSNLAEDKEALFVSPELLQILQNKVQRLKDRQLGLLKEVYNNKQPELSTHWLSEVVFQCDLLLKHTQNLYECLQTK